MSYLDRPFAPAEFMAIGCGGGHIGRLYWSNQKRLTPVHPPTNEIIARDHDKPGMFAFINTTGEWWSWLTNQDGSSSYP